jgi:hypothetical protein
MAPCDLQTRGLVDDDIAVEPAEMGSQLPRRKIMTFAGVLTTKRVALGCLCAGALAAAGCADGSGVVTRPSAGVSASALAASSPRTGDLYVTKECSQFAGLAGQFCTITSSNVAAIDVGSRVIYLTARGPSGLDSDVLLEPPGPGNNRAFGHCTLIAPVRLCTFSGGTGKFTHFQATAVVSLPLGGPGGPNFSWTGTYSFSPQD